MRCIVVSQELNSFCAQKVWKPCYWKLIKKDGYYLFTAAGNIISPFILVNWWFLGTMLGHKVMAQQRHKVSWCNTWCLDCGIIYLVNFRSWTLGQWHYLFGRQLQQHSLLVEKKGDWSWALSVFYLVYQLLIACAWRIMLFPFLNSWTLRCLDYYVVLWLLFLESRYWLRQLVVLWSGVILWTDQTVIGGKDWHWTWRLLASGTEGQLFMLIVSKDHLMNAQDVDMAVLLAWKWAESGTWPSMEQVLCLCIWHIGLSCLEEVFVSWSSGPWESAQVPEQDPCGFLEPLVQLQEWCLPLSLVCGGSGDIVTPWRMIAVWGIIGYLVAVSVVMAPGQGGKHLSMVS